MREHDVIGLDTTPCSTTDIVADIQDQARIAAALNSVDIVVHSAALHAPHVGLVSDALFEQVNIKATEQLARTAIESGIKHFVFTSTTALYGHASTPADKAGWVTEALTPQAKTIYHQSKIEAENRLNSLSKQHGVPITVLQMSRCFPEPADQMAVYRLCRGIDARDVAEAHLCAINKRLAGFTRFIISAKTPFKVSDCAQLKLSANDLIKQRCPKLAAEFEIRGWQLPKSIDRVYDSYAAQQELGWQSNYGFESVLEMLDSSIAEVLPAAQHRRT